MINRQIEREILTLKTEFPIIAILGPRQSGKTTLSKKLFPNYEYISLEDIDHREYAQNDPRGFLNRYAQDVIIDEIQRVPPLMSYLQTHVDKLNKNGKIIRSGNVSYIISGDKDLLVLKKIEGIRIEGLSKFLETMKD